MSSLPLQGRSVVVTGARGIAAACARTAAADGARVFVVAKNSVECAELLAELGGTDHGYALADLTSEAQAVEAFDQAHQTLGRVDGLLAVAGGSGRRFGDGPTHEITSEGWQETLALNLTTTFLAARAVVGKMINQKRNAGGRGSIVLMSSILAVAPDGVHFPTHAYAAAKGAIIALGTTMAAYYAPHGVRVNVVAPALVDTPMSTRAASDSATLGYARWKQPLSRGLLDPDAVAATMVFLLSDRARNVTGQLIGVDGGWSVTAAPPEEESDVG